MLSRQLIEELQEILRKRYGKEISFSEASQIGNGLVSHFDLLQKLNFKIENNHEDN